MDKFLDTNILQRLNHKEREIPNRSITSNKTASVIKSLPSKTIPGVEGF
jgi:hypothetical protein